MARRETEVDEVEDMFADDSDDVQPEMGDVELEEEDDSEIEDAAAAVTKASKTTKPASKPAVSKKTKKVVESKPAVQEDAIERPKSKGKEVKKTMPIKKEKAHRGTAKAAAQRGAVLAGYFSKPKTLRATYHGKEIKATVAPDGTIKFDGKVFTSPSGAGSSMRKGNSKVDGWHFWKIENKDGKLVTLDTLRQKKSA